jgi:hypothetical protein
LKVQAIVNYKPLEKLFTFLRFLPKRQIKPMLFVLCVFGHKIADQHLENVQQSEKTRVRIKVILVIQDEQHGMQKKQKLTLNENQ